ncbi:hypothetical protein M0802_010370 [Mischocyttarus mexicanus]|nr:hypothetical protein M0802_010370 [Mischocyttarus mexicanus]
MYERIPEEFCTGLRIIFRNQYYNDGTFKYANVTSIPPNKELLMFRSDGVWNINELGMPRDISFKEI